MLRQWLVKVLALAAAVALIVAACAERPSAPREAAGPAGTPALWTTLLPRTPMPSTPWIMPTSGSPGSPTASTSPSKQTTLSDEWRSPDGSWIARMRAVFGALGAAQGNQYETQLTVTRIDGARTWTPVDERRPAGLGFTTPAALAWSKDGRSLYYTNLPHPDGAPNVAVNGSDLWRLDLADGTVRSLSPELGPWLALSPDETRVAFVMWDGKVGVRDLATGEQRVTSLPDGQRSWMVEWTSPERVRLQDRAGRRWQFDPTTGQTTTEP